MARSDKPVEIRALAGARAFPPLLIVLYHFGEGHHYYGLSWLDAFAARGYLWVEFFFALSGFILTHVYGARVAQLFTPRGYGAFLKSRLTRLYPIHLFMLLALAALMWGSRAIGHWAGFVTYYDTQYHPIMSAKGFILSLLLVHGWNTMNSLTWNGASWFVSVEFALCLLFPLLLFLSQGKTWRGVALIGAGVAGLAALVLNTHYGLDITYHNGVLRGLADFGVGVGMAVLYRAAKPRDRLPAWSHSLIQAALLIALLYAFTHNGWSHNRGDIWCVLPMLALILALSFDRGILADALNTKLPQIMGGWSYAIYMGQTFWLQAIRVFEPHYPPGGVLVLGMRFSSLIWGLEPALLLLVCVGWGALLAKCIEHPAARLLKSR